MSVDLIDQKKDLSAQELALVTLELDRQKKSSTTMWLLWFFAGTFGGHRYYLGDRGRAMGQTGLFVLAIIVMIAGMSAAHTIQDVDKAVGTGYMLIGIPAVWALVDAFYITRRLQERNGETEAKIVERVRSLRSETSPEDDSQA